MMTASYQLSVFARQHLQKIKSYTVEQFSQQQWQNYKQTLLLGFSQLANHPDIGKPCPEIMADGFYFHIGKHTAYYTKEDGYIIIVAILNQSQLPQRHLR